MALSDLLNYLDRYTVQFPVKGSFVERSCSTIIVTTNIHPQQWYDYKNRESHYKAIARRFTRIYVFLESGCYEQEKDTFFHGWYGNISASKEKKVPLPWETTTSSETIQSTSSSEESANEEAFTNILFESDSSSSSEEPTFIRGPEKPPLRRNTPFHSVASTLTLTPTQSYSMDSDSDLLSSEDDVISLDD